MFNFIFSKRKSTMPQVQDKQSSPSPVKQTLLTGKVKFFIYKDDKKYGFITKDNSTEEVYFRLSDVDRSINKKELKPGLKVSFEENISDFTQKPCATNIQLA